MTDVGHDSTSGRSMDLNLNLDPTGSPRPRSLDLGSDLAFSSAPFSFSSIDESRVPSAAAASYMSAIFQLIDLHLPYSPSHASFVAASDQPPAAYPQPPSSGVRDDPTLEDSPSYQPFRPPYNPVSPPAPPLFRGPDLNDVPYSPSDSDEPAVAGVSGGAAHHLPYDPLYPSLGLANEPPVGGGGSDDSSHVPYSGSFIISTPPRGHSDFPFTSYQPIHTPVDAVAREDGPSSPRYLLQHPESRSQRLMESHRLRLRGARRFWSSLSYGDEPPNFATSSIPASDLLLSEIMSSHRSVETSGKNKAGDEGVDGDEGLEEEKEEKSASAVNFECNICFDVAKEPVVTTCGHLFCWPCLYQWLYLHCDHQECPVCKGEVIESNITPIYGRGSLETRVEEKGGEDVDLGFNIPPRPSGCRFESRRQQIQRPISERLGEGIVYLWRRVLDEELPNLNRLDENGGPSMLQELFSGVNHGFFDRSRTPRSIREGNNLETGFSIGQTAPPTNASSNPQNGGNTSSMLRDGTDFWHQFSPSGFTSTDRLAEITSGHLGGRFAGSGNNSGASASSVHPQNPDDEIVWRPIGSRHVTDQASVSASSVNPRNPDDEIVWCPIGSRHVTDRASASASSVYPRNPDDEIVWRPIGSRHVTDQASASSTMAAHVEVGVANALAEPNSAGSSRPLRRRGRSSGSASGSLDVDGGVLHARKTRRLN